MYRYRNSLFYPSFILNSVATIDSSGYQNENFPSCMQYVGARFIQVTEFEPSKYGDAKVVA